jgi:hypothetical protein
VLFKDSIAEYASISFILTLHLMTQYVVSNYMSETVWLMNKKGLESVTIPEFA